MYRDLRRGMDGPDVLQLQAALRAVGHSVHDRAGTFGPSTERAVRRLYQERGYEPPIEKLPAKNPQTGEAPSDGAGAGRGDENADATTDKPTPTPTSKPKPLSRAYVRLGEVVFLWKLPARVTEVAAGLGAEATGTILTLATGDLVVRGTLSPVDRDQVKTGMPVTILAEQKELVAKGRISSIGDFSAGGPADGEGGGDGGQSAGEGAGQGQPTEPGHPVVVRGTKGLDERFSGEDVRLTVETASTGGKVLVVPASAVYATADGSTQVIKLLSDDERQRVTVTAGAAGGGFVEVKSGGLAVGDRVVVGGGG
ncbi:MAG TPA: peptidoglycan-binding domain-containing protein [Streptosporangiaceae bacterium]|nr:peptidoglycan-binding domain-containing protein [Streptosporangiaceae bacterium]